MDYKENVFFQNCEKMDKNLNSSGNRMSFLSDITKSQINKGKQTSKIKKCPSLKLIANDLPKEMIIKTLNLVNSLNEIYINTLKKTLKQMRDNGKTSQKSFLLMLPILKRICGLKHFYETKLMRSSFSIIKSLYLVDICTKNQNFERKKLAMTKFLFVIQSQQSIIEKTAFYKLKIMKNADLVIKIQKSSFLLLQKIAKNLKQSFLRFFFHQIKKKMSYVHFEDNKSKKFQDLMNYIISSKKYSIFHNIRIFGLKKLIETEKQKQILLLITKVFWLEKKQSFEKLKNFSAKKDLHMKWFLQQKKKYCHISNLLKKYFNHQKKEIFNKILGSQISFFEKKNLLRDVYQKKGVSLLTNLEKFHKKRINQIFE